MAFQHTTKTLPITDRALVPRLPRPKKQGSKGLTQHHLMLEYV